MVDEALVRALIMQLEKEYGKPVQLRVETPEPRRTEDFHYLGSFMNRQVTVKVAEGLPAMYEEASQLRQVYLSMKSLEVQVEEMNTVWKKRHGVPEGEYRRDQYILSTSGVLQTRSHLDMAIPIGKR